MALEIWYRAVGREVAGHRLATYRCKRCAGYHVALKRVRPAATTFLPPLFEVRPGETTPAPRRVAAWG